MKARRGLIETALALLLATPGVSAAAPVSIVAAENFYGAIAQEIGGPEVAATSILSSPDQDPHLFEASASTARQIDSAQLLIVNGADYDPWMDKLIGASVSARRKVINVAELVGKKSGDNPHLWYDPATIESLADALRDNLVALDPAHADGYAARSAAFLDGLRPLEARIAELRQRYANTPVAASEPVFGYMAMRLGLDMREGDFALAVMNNTEPAASAVAGFEADLKQHRVRAMLFNSQASEPSVERLVAIARAEKIPVVGVTETEPAGTSYKDWMLAELNALDAALAAGSP